jgi:glycosyltransferase involved in cell wall biosynthesis
MSDPRIDELPAPILGKSGWPWTEASWSKHEDVSDCPRITVITPSYNQGGFLEETIRSVLLQGYPNLEYIIMDGDSNDTTLDVISRYEPWIECWASEKDRGQSHAINKGFQKATGEFVMWLNADDLLFRDALNKVGHALRLLPDAGMIYGTGTKIDAEGNVLKRIPFRPYNEMLLRTLFFILQPSSLVRRSCLSEVGFLTESLHYAMDWDLSLKLSRVCKIYAIDMDIGMLRMHATCKTLSGGSVRQREIARIARKHNGFFDPNVLGYYLLPKSAGLENATGRRRGVLSHYWAQMVRVMLDKIFGTDTYMM